MPRKRTKTPANFDKAFPSQLRKLFEETGHTQSELADFIKQTCNKEKFSRQAVAYYYNGSSSPDWETLVAIAKFFNVSLDYLTDSTKPKTVDPNVKMICEYTGLSEEAVEALHGASLHSLNTIFEAEPGQLIALHACIHNALSGYKNDNRFAKCLEGHEDLYIAIRESGGDILAPSDLMDYYIEQAGNTLKEIIRNAVQEQRVKEHTEENRLDSFIDGVIQKYSRDPKED